MGTKITDLTALGTLAATNDVLTIVDVSDTTGGTAGTSKKITVANLVGAVDQEISITKTRAEINALANSTLELLPATAGQINIVTEMRFILNMGASGTTTEPTQDLNIQQSTNANPGLKTGIFPRATIGQICTNTTSASSAYYRDVPATGGRVYDENKATKLGVPAGFSFPTKVTSLTIQISYKAITP